MKDIKSSLLILLKALIFSLFIYQPQDCLSQTWVPIYNSDGYYLFPDPLETRIGIGLDSREISAQLHIKSTIDSRVKPFIIQTGNPETKSIKYFVIGKTGNVGIGYDNPLSAISAQLHIRYILEDNTTPFLIDGNDENQYNSFIINSRGLVGIGTTDPHSKLHVIGDATVSDLANPTDNYIVTTDIDGKFILLDKNSLHDNLGNHKAMQNLIMSGYWIKNNALSLGGGIFIDNANNVGIGINSPLAMLHVNGTAKILRGLTVGEALYPASFGVFGPSVLNGTLKVTGLQSNQTPTSMIVADMDGNLGVAPVPVGDNMGNCEATQNLKMGDNCIVNSTPSDNPIRPDGSRYCEGLHFDTDNNMVLETGATATLTLVSNANTKSQLWVGNWTSGGYGLVCNYNNTPEGNQTGGIYWDKNNPQAAINFNNTKVGIGVMPPSLGNYNLYVKGGILTEEVKVQLEQDWPDFVFKSDYKLQSLKNVETFIAKNQHLPDLPSAESVKKDGINLGEIDSILLKKIEELTLYIIQQQKQIDKQQSEINSLKSN
jgi:hypothetical protein